jgi:hypothetical protein
MIKLALGGYRLLVTVCLLHLHYPPRAIQQLLIKASAYKNIKANFFIPVTEKNRPGFEQNGLDAIRMALILRSSFQTRV